MSSAVQLNPLHIVIGEIQNVVSAMRLNSRWASRSTLVTYLSESHSKTIAFGNLFSLFCSSFCFNFHALRIFVLNNHEKKKSKHFRID
jgi:hypothetical protein